MKLEDSATFGHGPAGRRVRHLLVWGCAALAVTGAGWLLAHDVWLVQTAFGPQPHPASSWLLRLHGALAWCVTLVAGIVWQAHVRPAWRSVRRRRTHQRRLGRPLRSAGQNRWRTVSGVLLVGALAVLVASAIGLQYGPDDAHAWLSATHWGVGFALAGALAWHWTARLRG